MQVEVSKIPLQDTVSNMSWLLSNVEPLLDFRRPTLHSIVDLGGIGVHQPSPLDEVGRCSFPYKLRERLSTGRIGAAF